MQITALIIKIRYPTDETQEIFSDKFLKLIHKTMPYNQTAYNDLAYDSVQLVLFSLNNSKFGKYVQRVARIL